MHAMHVPFRHRHPSGSIAPRSSVQVRGRRYGGVPYPEFGMRGHLHGSVRDEDGGPGDLPKICGAIMRHCLNQFGIPQTLEIRDFPEIV